MYKASRYPSNVYAFEYLLLAFYVRKWDVNQKIAALKVNEAIRKSYRQFIETSDFLDTNSKKRLLNKVSFFSNFKHIQLII